MTPLAKRRAIAILHDEHGVSVRQACEAVRSSRAAYYRPIDEHAQLRHDQAVIDALQAKVNENTRWGFWKCFDALRLEGTRWNHKRVHRVYCALHLKHSAAHTPAGAAPDFTDGGRAPALNLSWALDFMVDTLYDGRRFRTLSVDDESNREGLAIEIGTTLANRRRSRR